MVDKALLNFILSVCPGLDLLGMAFEQEGFTVVRGGDPLFGQLGIEGFHPPPGIFAGVIGGPPCGRWAKTRNLAKGKERQPNLIPEFERVVAEARPRWFLMENVTGAPIPRVEGYNTQSLVIYAWELGSPQRRPRRFTFGSNPPVLLLWPHGERPPRGTLTLTAKKDAQPGQRKVIETMTATARRGGFDRPHELNALPEAERVEAMKRKVLPTMPATNTMLRLRSGDRMRLRGKTCFTLDDYREGFGLPPDWDAPVCLQVAKFKLLGNGVPLQVGRPLARAIKEAGG